MKEELEFLAQHLKPRQGVSWELGVSYCNIDHKNALCEHSWWVLFWILRSVVTHAEVLLVHCIPIGSCIMYSQAQSRQHGWQVDINHCGSGAHRVCDLRSLSHSPECSRQHVSSFLNNTYMQEVKTLKVTGQVFFSATFWFILHWVPSWSGPSQQTTPHCWWNLLLQEVVQYTPSKPVSFDYWSLTNQFLGFKTWCSFRPLHNLLLMLWDIVLFKRLPHLKQVRELKRSVLGKLTTYSGTVRNTSKIILVPS
jgi:hypothetical protein